MVGAGAGFGFVGALVNTGRIGMCPAACTLKGYAPDGGYPERRNDTLVWHKHGDCGTHTNR
ncbi:MAG: hypothetical protein HXX08_23195 [Chloroflexi bacterium]|uniref:Uncharacterized protein n=1 Tax=Candidatus Chlorohelix allophototropha TaxID=3003348 RepID=A0A8T7M9H5_9CHLR|nr:hypothetical protein [Chloroflexota bacterium]WJW68712.1 hypothetical protein OZ401_004328 [Chloroflexota bacterium L227-S17]